MHNKMETPLCEAPSHARLCKITEASSETHTFDFQVGFSILVGACFCEKPYAKTQLSICHAIRPFMISKSVDSKSRFRKSSAPGKPPGKQPCTGAPFPNGSSATGKDPRVAPQLASRLQHVTQMSWECPLQCTQ